MTAARDRHTATLLPNGNVLVAGMVGYTASAEVYDPAGGTWTATGPMMAARFAHTATLLPDGEVLVAGGSYAGGGAFSSSELYDAGLGFTNSWRPRIAPLSSAFSLGSGLVVAGSQFRGVSSASGGNTQESSTDYPLLQLRGLESQRNGGSAGEQLVHEFFHLRSHLEIPSRAGRWPRCSPTAFKAPAASSTSGCRFPRRSWHQREEIEQRFVPVRVRQQRGLGVRGFASTNLSLPFTNWAALGRSHGDFSRPVRIHRSAGDQQSEALLQGARAVGQASRLSPMVFSIGDRRDACPTYIC